MDHSEMFYWYLFSISITIYAVITSFDIPFFTMEILLNTEKNIKMIIKKNSNLYSSVQNGL